MRLVLMRESNGAFASANDITAVDVIKNDAAIVPKANFLKVCICPKLLKVPAQSLLLDWIFFCLLMMTTLEAPVRLRRVFGTNTIT